MSLHDVNVLVYKYALRHGGMKAWGHGFVVPLFHPPASGPNCPTANCQLSNFPTGQLPTANCQLSNCPTGQLANRPIAKSVRPLFHNLKNYMSNNLTLIISFSPGRSSPVSAALRRIRLTRYGRPRGRSSSLISVPGLHGIHFQPAT